MFQLSSEYFRNYTARALTRTAESILRPWFLACGCPRVICGNQSIGRENGRKVKSSSCDGLTEGTDFYDIQSCGKRSFLDNAAKRRYAFCDMRPEAVTRMLQDAGAIKQGHFELSSGLHSGTYVQCALVLQYPEYAEQLGRALAEKFADLRVDCVASPAIGGVIVGHEVARAIARRTEGKPPMRAIFVERDASGSLTLRRGFRVEPDEHVLVVEDVWTTGGSTYETIRVLEEAGARVVAAGALIDRSGGRVELPVRTEALMELKVDTYHASDCPLCRSGSIAVRPGSRFVRAGN